MKSKIKLGSLFYFQISILMQQIKMICMLTFCIKAKIKNSTNKKFLKEILKVAIQNRLSNVKIAESNKTALVHFPETATWRWVVMINTDVVDPQNEFSGYMSLTVPYGSDVQVPVKHEFSETFERDKFDEKFIGKGELHYIF